MGAWKLRAIVYGLLAVVSALVLVQRGAFAGGAAEPHHLRGVTRQGSQVQMAMSGTRVEGFTIESIRGVCRGGRPYSVNWWPSTSQANVTYRRSGDWFFVHERSDPRFPHAPGTRAHLYMHGRVSRGGRTVEGRVWYSAHSKANDCRSDTVAFSASDG